MERLTTREFGKPAALVRVGDTLDYVPPCQTGNNPRGYLTGDIVTRLAEYEDTGLTPKEITTMMEDIETRFYNYIAMKCGRQAGEVVEILQAAIEGRVLALPCPIGTAVYVHEPICREGKRLTYEGCKYGQDCTKLWGIPCPVRVVKRAFTVNMRNGLGKTFWLSPEEAEAAISADRRNKP